MSLNPLLTHNAGVPLYALAGAGGGGGGGGSNIPALTVSSISGNPEFTGNAVYMTQPNSTGGADGLTFVTNPPASFGATLVSTVGMEMNIGGQVAYILESETPGLGSGNGLNIIANGITLGSSQGVAINGGAGAGAGSLAVSSISVSSINGLTPGGGGGGSALPVVSTIGVNTQTIWGSGGPVAIGPTFAVNAGSTYQVVANVSIVSSFAPPSTADRMVFLADAIPLDYIDLPFQVDANLHNPKGFQVGGIWTPSGSLAELSVYCNGASPSTVFQLDGPSAILVQLS
jgi:hypothetical protein